MQLFRWGSSVTGCLELLFSSPTDSFAVTYAVGDIHGRSDLLKLLLEKIREHRKSVQGRAKIVFLGDYIDRGSDDKGVLEILRSDTLRRSFDEVVLLTGNHELMLQNDLERFELERRGGKPEELLEAVDLDTEKTYGLNRLELRGFLSSLPLFHSDGIRLFTHAGVRND